METYFRIKQLCESRNIRMAEMARGAGIRNSVLTELKMGRTRQLSVPTLEKIAAFFDVPVAYFVDSSEGKVCEEAKEKRRLIYELTENVPESELDAILERLRAVTEGTSDAEG